MIDIDVPTVMLRLAAGSLAVYLDLVSAMRPGSFHHSRNALDKAPLLSPSSAYPAALMITVSRDISCALHLLKALSPPTAEPSEYNSFPFGTFINGTSIPKRRYKVLMCALKIAGDAKSESSCESWLSTPFSVV